MWSLRVTSPDGRQRIVPFAGNVATIGRAADNTIVLDGAGVSSHHCMFEAVGPTCRLTERGSTNGTYVNHRKVEPAAPAVVTPNDRIYVGSYLVELVAASVPAAVSAAPRTTGGYDAPPSRPMTSGGGPILRAPSADRAWRDLHGRLSRYAEQWEEAGRPDRLALSSTELRQALRWLKHASPDANPPVEQLQRDFIAASQGAIGRRKLKLALGIAGGVIALGGLVTTAILLWPEDEPESTDTQTDGATDETKKRDRIIDEPPPPRDASDRPKIREEMVHVVIPIETYDDIANRYGVSTADLARWNAINPDEPPTVGEELSIKKPTKRPLPQQQINYEVEPGETSWTKLSERFGLSVQKLRAYNPERSKPPKVGETIVVWIDPRPYKPRLPKKPIPTFEPNQNAVAVGHPNSGHLDNGVQMPPSELYTRRYPRLMYGSGFMVANLQTAIANFRQDLDFDGELVLADMSRNGGGNFPPHKSHQQGRDIDIWLPTLRGVFKAKYLTDDGDKEWGRRPLPSEADWFATWGLVKALGETGAVQEVFLDISLHDRVYNAAKLMGASDEELDKLIQWPRKYPTQDNILRHSAHHTHHIHVRFKCAPWESACKKFPLRGGGEE